MTSTDTVQVDSVAVVGNMTVTASFSAGTGITALFGPSGAGKSVTLATVAGLLRPRSGTITLHGTCVADAERGVHVRTQDRQLGMVFQHAALLPHRSPLDNVALGCRGGDRTTRREAARHWLDRVHAAHLATARTATLSGGEQQRISLARALAGQPRLLLLDEPFSALDQPTRQSLRALLRNLVDAEELTALLVTHDLTDIVELADRVVLFEPGCTVASHPVTGSTPEDLPRLLGLSP